MRFCRGRRCRKVAQKEGGVCGSAFLEITFLPLIHNTPPELGLSRAQMQMLPALQSWAEQVSVPRSLLRRLSHGGAPFAAIAASSSHTQGFLLPRFSKATPTIMATGSASPLCGESTPRRCIPPPKHLKPANMDVGSLQRASPGRVPSSLCCRAALPLQWETLQVGSPASQAACKQLERIKPKSISQKLPASRLWDDKGTKLGRL